jgi:hypothetical protein
MEVMGEVLALKADFVFSLLTCAVGIIPLSTEFTNAFVQI